MKKKLEAELISIAHRILKLKNKSDIIQLHQETQKLYEKLSVLRFLEENFTGAVPTIGKAEVEERLDNPYVAIETEKTEALPAHEAEKPDEEQNAPDVPNQPKAALPEEIKAQEPIPEPITEIEEKEVDQVIAEVEQELTEEIAKDEEPTEVTADDVSEAESESADKQVAPSTMEQDLFKPAFEWQFETKSEEPKESVPQGQIAFDELLGKGYIDPVFVTRDELHRDIAASNEALKNIVPITRNEDKVIPVFKIPNSEIADKAVSLNDRLSKGITVGLNDRIAFVKHLFGNNNEDYNRVLSQLITFATLEEAQEFIDTMVKPDYNDWSGKDEYAQRFMEVIEKKFT